MASIHPQLATQIVETIKSVCDHDINYIDEQGRIIASTDPARIGEFHDAGFRAARSGQPVVVTDDLPENDLKKGYNMPILYHGDVMAVIGITGDPDRVRRYAGLAQRITLLLLREHEIDLRDRSDRRQTEHLILMMIRGERIRPEYRSSVLQLNGFDSAAGLWRCVLVSVRGGEGAVLTGRTERGIADAFERIGGLHTFLPPDHFVLITTDEKLSKGVSHIRALADRFPGSVLVGIGSAHKFSAQDRSYEEAALAVRNSQSGDAVHYFDSLDLDLLFAGLPAAVSDAFLEKTFSRLSDSDRRLLAVYYDCGMSLQDTAKQLFLHKNTLQYKLNRIREKSGYDPRSFCDAVLLYLSVRLAQFLPPADEAASSVPRSGSVTLPGPTSHSASDPHSASVSLE